MEMPTVEAAGRHSLALVLAAAAGAALGCLVLHLIDRHLRGRLEQRATFDVLAAAVVATLEPAQARPGAPRSGLPLPQGRLPSPVLNACR